MFEATVKLEPILLLNVSPHACPFILIAKRYLFAANTYTITLKYTANKAHVTFV